MQWSSLNQAAALALLFSSASQAHLIMKSPVPYGKDTIDNSPLTSQNFPCKYTGDKSFYSNAVTNKMAIGEPQTLSFEGSATHDGGSCQLALTKDLAPTASTSWGVILSIEGGCPTKGGGAPSDYEFTIPDSVAPGEYSFAWHWTSKLSGVQEYYMNCAKIEVTAGNSKRSYDNETMIGSYDNETMIAPRAESFPEMFVGNLAGINSCKTTLSTDPKYPDPGSNVEHFGKPDYGKVTGSNCVGKGLKEGPATGLTSTGGSGGSTGGGDGGDSGSGGSDGGSDGGDDSCSEDPAPSATPTPSGSPSSGSPTPSSEPSSAPPPAPSSAVPSSTPVASPSSAPTPGGGGSGAGKTGACTTEGTFNCDGSSYQQCAAGQWTSMQSLPGGTSCVKGESTSLWARDIPRRARNSRRKDC